MPARTLKVPSILHRTAVIERSAIDEQARTVELSFSSEAPVDRYFGIEILDHAPASVRLERIRSAGPLLFNHDRDAHIGRIESAEIRGGKGYAKVRFSQSAIGQEKFRDVVDGILQEVSVGYRILESVLEKTEQNTETYRCTLWEPMEISLVTMPADVSVGVGRAADHPDTTEIPLKENISRTMSATAPEITVKENEVRAAERNRLKSIRQGADVIRARNLCDAAALDALVNRAADEGLDEAAFNREVMGLISSKPAAPATQVRGELGLSEKEKGRYSMLRAIRLISEGRPLDGLEREASDAEAKRVGRSAQGFFVPAEIFTAKRAMEVNPAANGGYTVGQSIDTGNMVELLRNQSHVIALGARVISGLVGDVSIPRVLSGSSVYWVSESGTITSSNATFGQLALKPRRIGATVPYTKQFLAQSGLDPESFIRDDVMGAMGVELDRVAINGNGGSEPLGILSLPSAERATGVTFGAAPTWSKVVSFETNVETANALGLPGSAYAYLTTPGVKGAWKTTSKVANTAVFLWENGDIVNGYAARSTNQVPSNKVIFGQMGQVIYGEWAGIDITVDPYSLATTGQVRVTIQKLVDMVIRQGKAFSVSSDAGNQ